MDKGRPNRAIESMCNVSLSKLQFCLQIIKQLPVNHMLTLTALAIRDVGNFGKDQIVL